MFNKIKELMFVGFEKINQIILKINNMPNKSQKLAIIGVLIYTTIFCLLFLFEIIKFILIGMLIYFIIYYAVKWRF